MPADVDELFYWLVNMLLLFQEFEMLFFFFVGFFVEFGHGRQPFPILQNCISDSRAVRRAALLFRILLFPIDSYFRLIIEQCDGRFCYFVFDLFPF